MTDNALRMGMLRGTRFNPLNIVRDGKDILLQQPPAGVYVYRYSFTSGKGNWTGAKSWRAGMGFNTPLIPVSAVNELSRKTLAPERSFCEVNPDNVVISAIKKSDRDAAIVLRVFEIRGESANTTVRFLGQERGMRAVNLLEEDADGPAQKVLRVRPYEIETVKLQ